MPLFLDIILTPCTKTVGVSVSSEDLDRVLYLDPDILVINDIQPLYEADLTQWLVCSSGSSRLLTKELNQVRLMEYELNEYFNSGVLLMNLLLQRNT